MTIQDTNEKALMTMPNIDLLISEYNRGARSYTRVYIKMSDGTYKLIHDSKWPRTNAASLRDIKFIGIKGEGGYILE